MKAGRLERRILANRGELARKSKLLSKGDPVDLEDLFRLQGMADGGKQKDNVLRPFHQGRSNRAAPAIVSAMSYILEIWPAAT